MYVLDHLNGMAIVWKEQEAIRSGNSGLLLMRTTMQVICIYLLAGVMACCIYLESTGRKKAVE